MADDPGAADITPEAINQQNRMFRLGRDNFVRMLATEEPQSVDDMSAAIDGFMTMASHTWAKCDPRVFANPDRVFEVQAEIMRTWSDQLKAKADAVADIDRLPVQT